MNELPYYSIPGCPDEVSATNTIARFIDGLGFRYRWATEGLTENEMTFRPEKGSKNMIELLNHIYDLAYRTSHTFGETVSADKRPETFSELRENTLVLYFDLSSRLKEMDDAALIAAKTNGRMINNQPVFWYFMNGPIADALTHVGQITSWRRIAGNPQPKGVNVFFGTGK
ncbi:MAG: hypothetical protein ACI8VT_000492 [Saprospiraceae bacterium]|jgi:hypothetical protein